MVSVVGIAQVGKAADVGVNVYVVVVVLSIAGDHVPEIPFILVVGNAGIGSP